jgi:hypothetical protein
VFRHVAQARWLITLSWPRRWVADLHTLAAPS